jgi:hypothetical protein
MGYKKSNIVYIFCYQTADFLDLTHVSRANYKVSRIIDLITLYISGGMVVTSRQI